MKFCIIRLRYLPSSIILLRKFISFLLSYYYQKIIPKDILITADLKSHLFQHQTHTKQPKQFQYFSFEEQIFISQLQQQ